MKRLLLLLSASLSGCALLLSHALEGRECGDGIVDEGIETCDDGNTTAGDGCDATCQEELGACGDGVLNAGEACDDGAALLGDGCDAACAVEPGFACAGAPSVCASICGDGLIVGPEGCDDGDVTSGDGCDSSCEIEANFTCVGAPSVCTPSGVVCGDGDIDAGEECDDGSLTNDDGCNESCQVDATSFVFCDSSVGGDGSAGAPFGSIQEAIADASDGDIILITSGSPTCVGTITIDKSLTLRGPLEADVPPLLDGGTAAAVLINKVDTSVTLQDLAVLSDFNGGGAIRVQNGASAALLRVDVSNINLGGGGANASAECSGAGELLVDQSIIHDSPGCGVHVKASCRALVTNSLLQNNGSTSNRGAVRAEAGSAVLVALSTFDNNTDSNNRGVMECNSDAVLESADSIIANNNNGSNVLDPECNLLSSITFGATPQGIDLSSADPRFIDAAGQDFHLLSNSPAIDAASSFFAPPFDPVASFGVDVFSHDFGGSPRPIGAGFDLGMFEAPACGNSIAELGEDCDDGNDLNGDGCEENCTFNECGNGLLAAPEACDDNNLIDGDGCQASCAVSACGDGIVDLVPTVDSNSDGVADLAEECEDNNAIDGDGCDNDCQFSCGNGQNDANEDCDDGNTNNFDGCPNDCFFEFCGDAVRDGFEECDDGNNTDGDGCDNNCQNSCGNGVLDLLNNEACDDGDNINGDGCNNNCAIATIQEQEPNDDGNTSPNGGNQGNDFSINGAQPLTNSAVIQGNISNGDEDIFRLTNTANFQVRIRAEIASNNQFTFCTFDSLFVLRDQNGFPFDGNDDSGIGACSFISDLSLNPGQTIFLQVLDFNDDDSFSYFLRIFFDP